MHVLQNVCKVLDSTTHMFFSVPNELWTSQHSTCETTPCYKWTKAMLTAHGLPNMTDSWLQNMVVLVHASILLFCCLCMNLPLCIPPPIGLHITNTVRTFPSDSYMSLNICMCKSASNTLLLLASQPCAYTPLGPRSVSEGTPASSCFNVDRRVKLLQHAS